MTPRTALLLPVLLSTLGTAAVHGTVQIAILLRASVGLSMFDSRVWILEGASIAVTLALGCLVAVSISRVADAQQLKIDLAERGRLIAEADREALITALGHEFRTPIHGVAGSLELLSDDLSDDDREALMSAATASSRRLASLVEELLESSPSMCSEEEFLSQPPRTGLVSVRAEPTAQPVLLVASPNSDIAGTLEGLDQAFDLVHTASEAQERLDRATYDLVLCEIPAAGVAAVDDLRTIADARGALTAFIALGRPQDRDPALEAGWDEALVHGSRLRADLADLLDRWMPDAKMAS